MVVDIDEQETPEMSVATHKLHTHEGGRTCKPNRIVRDPALYLRRRRAAWNFPEWSLSASLRFGYVANRTLQAIGGRCILQNKRHGRCGRLCPTVSIKWAVAAEVIFSERITDSLATRSTPPFSIPPTHNRMTEFIPLVLNQRDRALIPGMGFTSAGRSA